MAFGIIALAVALLLCATEVVRGTLLPRRLRQQSPEDRAQSVGLWTRDDVLTPACVALVLGTAAVLGARAGSTGWQVWAVAAAVAAATVPLARWANGVVARETIDLEVAPRPAGTIEHEQTLRRRRRVATVGFAVYVEARVVDAYLGVAETVVLTVAAVGGLVGVTAAVMQLWAMARGPHPQPTPGSRGER